MLSTLMLGLGVVFVWWLLVFDLLSVAPCRMERDPGGQCISSSAVARDRHQWVVSRPAALIHSAQYHSDSKIYRPASEATVTTQSQVWSVLLLSSQEIPPSSLGPVANRKPTGHEVSAIACALRLVSTREQAPHVVALCLPLLRGLLVLLHLGSDGGRC